MTSGLGGGVYFDNLSVAVGVRVVPLPSALLLMVTSLFGLRVFMRKKIT